MGLNRTGKIRLAILLGIPVVGVVIFGIILNSTNELPPVIIQAMEFIVLPELLLIMSFYANLYQQVQDSIFQKLGFTAIDNSDALVEYYIGQHEMSRVQGFYKGDTNHPYNVIRFQVQRGYGKGKRFYRYVGLEFMTASIHDDVQIRSAGSPIQPRSSTPRQLESTEFSAHFKIYSEIPEAPYYFLDPDSMSDLIDVRNAVNFPINMEISGQHIFIFVTKTDFKKFFAGGLSIMEILNNQIHPDKEAQYIQDLEKFTDQIKKIFDLLDYKVATA